MNILPLVTAFILIFSLGAYTLLHQSIATKQEERLFKGAQRLHWKEASMVESAIYKLHPGKSLTTKKPKEDSKKPKVYLSPRSRFNLSENAKLNIYPLLRDEHPPPLLRKIALDLLSVIYERTPLHAHINDQLLDTLIETAKAHPEVTSLSSLYAKIEEKSRPLFYLLLNGTQSYALYTNHGYPALSDFFTIESKRAPILMAHASEALLKAGFGDVFTKRLIQEEKEIWEEKKQHIPLKKGAIEALFLKFKQGGQTISDYTDLLDYKEQEGSLKQQVYLDKESKILHRFRG